MIEIRQDGFYIDGSKFRIFSGAMHYFRILPELWENRFAKMAACGFNTVETVMCWNLHEPKEGEFCFDGMLDIVKFCQTAQRYGLKVIIRPGPYTCGEWDFGGFPAWTLQYQNIRYRCDEPIFMSKVKSYFQKILALLTPLQVDNGGNIIAMQIENEYGSYGNDKQYLAHLERIMLENGVTVPLFTSDGNCCDMLSGGTLPHIYKTLNFGSRAKNAFDCLSAEDKKLPKTCMEFWCGWFDHWGERHHKRNSMAVATEIKDLIEIGANLNIYMFHGGTNFGFWAGANYDYKYKPTVTSYDDAALLNEYGEYTKAYHAIRELLHAAQNKPLGMLPPSPTTQNIGKVWLTQRASLWDNLKVIGKRFCSANVETMEHFGQNFGYILYSKNLTGKYSASTLYIEGVHDIAYLRIDGKLVKSYDRTKNGRERHNDGFKYKLPAFDGVCKIEILVEAMGRVNYGPHLVDPKGIQRVRLGNQIVYTWDIYTLPMDNLGKLDFQEGGQTSGSEFLKGTFRAERGKDAFLALPGFNKGFVTINGYNIGRYWKRGPQKTLYIPSVLLKDKNEIIVMEQVGHKNNFVDITDKHDLG